MLFCSLELGFNWAFVAYSVWLLRKQRKNNESESGIAVFNPKNWLNYLILGCHFDFNEV